MRSLLVNALGNITQGEVYLYRNLKSTPNLLNMPYEDFNALCDINASITEAQEKEHANNTNSRTVER